MVETEELALSIYRDLLSDTPSYDYDLAATGIYERQLHQLKKARMVNQEAAKGVVLAIRARAGSELATLLDGQDKDEKENEAPAILPLPEQARLPQGFLPQNIDGKANWLCRWDSSKLRKVSPWLADYIAYSYQASPEGYVDFHISCGLWALSAIAARRVYVELAKPMYTPLAVALVARTSLFAKTTTADAAITLLKKAGLGWLLGDDETTPQKLLADMAGHIPTNYEDMDADRKEEVKRRLAMSGQIGWYYDEFNQLLDAMTRPGPMAEFAGLLRKLDNCPDEYKYSTRSHGQEVITKPYLPLLANTTPANLRQHASKGGGFWNDGFWARFAFITPPPNSFVTKTMKRGRVIPPASLSTALAQWNDRLGVPRCEIEEIVNDDKPTGRYTINKDPLQAKEVTISDEAYEAYERYRLALRSMIAEAQNQDLDGSYSRLADKALRIATLIGSLENNNHIDLAIWTLAQEIAEMFRANLHEFYNQTGKGKAEESPLEDTLIEFIKKQDKPVTAREVYQGVRKLQSLGTTGIRDLLIALEQSGIAESRKDGRKECYTLVK